MDFDQAMNDDLVKFSIPARFVLERVSPSPSEILYGYRHGWLAADAVVAIGEAKIASSEAIPAALEELALLLRHELSKVPELVDRLERRVMPGGDSPAALWLYVALDWLYHHRSEYIEPLEMIEMLYADFDYPHEIEGLIRHMPAPEGVRASPERIYQAWRDYLRRNAEYYSNRPAD